MTGTGTGPQKDPKGGWPWVEGTLKTQTHVDYEDPLAHPKYHPRKIRNFRTKNVLPSGEWYGQSSNSIDYGKKGPVKTFDCKRAEADIPKRPAQSETTYRVEHTGERTIVDVIPKEKLVPSLVTFEGQSIYDGTVGSGRQGPAADSAKPPLRPVPQNKLLTKSLYQDSYTNPPRVPKSRRPKMMPPPDVPLGAHTTYMTDFHDKSPVARGVAPPPGEHGRHVGDPLVPFKDASATKKAYRMKPPFAIGAAGVGKSVYTADICTDSGIPAVERAAAKTQE